MWSAAGFLFPQPKVSAADCNADKHTDCHTAAVQYATPHHGYDGMKAPQWQLRFSDGKRFPSLRHFITIAEALYYHR